MISAQRRAKISWHCRRGMLELDLIFGRFLTQQLNELTEEQLLAFEELLTHPDPDLYAWFMGYEIPAQKELLEIVTLIKTHDTI